MNCFIVYRVVLAVECNRYFIVRCILGDIMIRTMLIKFTCASILLGSCLLTYTADNLEDNKKFLPDTIVTALQELQKEFAVLEKKYAQAQELSKKRQADLQQTRKKAETYNIYGQPRFTIAEYKLPQELAMLMKEINDNLKLLQAYVVNSRFMQFIEAGILREFIQQLNPIINVEGNKKITAYQSLPLDPEKTGIPAELLATILLELNQLNDLFGQDRLMSLQILYTEYTTCQNRYKKMKPGHKMPNNPDEIVKIKKDIQNTLLGHIEKLLVLADELGKKYRKEEQLGRDTHARQVALQKEIFKKDPKHRDSIQRTNSEVQSSKGSPEKINAA
jgi:hypothetical protein